MTNWEVGGGGGFVACEYIYIHTYVYSYLTRFDSSAVVSFVRCRWQAHVSPGSALATASIIVIRIMLRINMHIPILICLSIISSSSRSIISSSSSSGSSRSSSVILLVR